MGSVVKELLLLRHAKSSWDDPAIEDFGRALALRGRKAAPLVGRELAARGWIPEKVLVSSALRTRQTWDLVRLELGNSAPPVEDSRILYMAPAAQILAVLRVVPSEISSVLLIGHNPGLEDLARRLAGPGSDEAALARLARKYPTAALARFVHEGSWSTLDFAGPRLTHFLRPKDIGA